MLFVFDCVQNKEEEDATMIILIEGSTVTIKQTPIIKSKNYGAEHFIYKQVFAC